MEAVPPTKTRLEGRKQHEMRERKITAARIESPFANERTQPANERQELRIFKLEEHSSLERIA